MSRQKMLEKRFALYSDVYETIEDLQRDLDRDAVELPPPLPPPLSSPAATSSTSSVAPNATAATAGKDSKVPTAAASSEAPPPPQPPPAVVKPTKAPHQYSSSSSTRNTRQSDIWGNPIVPDFFVVCSVCGQKVNGPRFTTHLVSACLCTHMENKCFFFDDMAFSQKKFWRRITATTTIITHPQNKCMGVPKMGRAGQGMNSQSMRG